ncbi:hypothetical protein K3495_g1871 [Podosphaera aphanis]|nr:hypothetical protein K3495_g1871 [Podosphaera aphanis]
MANKKKKNFRKANHHGEHTQNRRPQAFPAESASAGAANGNGTSKNFRNEFTLQEVAKNTKKKDFWKSDRKLRNSKISFISAGTLEPFKPKDTATAFANLRLNSYWRESNTPEIDKVQGTEEDTSGNTIQAQDSTIPTRCPGYFIDLHGTKPVHTGFSPPCIRSPSPTPSDSSEEVILFKGRNFQESFIDSAPKIIETPAVLKLDPTARAVEDAIQVQESINEKNPLLNQQLPLQRSDSPVKDPPSLDKYPSKKICDTTDSSEKNNRGLRNTDIEEEALMNDYLENMDSEDVNYMLSFARRELDIGSLNDHPETRTSSSSSHWMKLGESENDSPILQDFDDLSTTESIRGKIQEILAQRDQNSEVQYLVVWQGLSIREAQWVPMSSLTNSNALSMIELFKAKDKLSGEFSDETEEEDSGMSDDSSDTDQSSSEGEVGYLYKRHNRSHSLSDEDIARILAKQEELGMAADEILLFDESLSTGVGLTSKSQKKKNSRAARKNKAKKGGPKRSKWNECSDSPFPLTSSIVDPLEEFDFTKFEPFSQKGKGRKRELTPNKSGLSSRIIDPQEEFDFMKFGTFSKKGKGRKGNFTSNKINLEFEEQMRTSWQKDRSKKKKRKQERENLRVQGLLGNKNNQPNLHQKYHDGMNNVAMRKEIKAFLKSGNSTLAFPPMTKTNRKYAHEIANAFNMKSKSRGSGLNRFPVLYRTSKTFNFSEEIFKAVETQIACRFLYRGQSRGKVSGLKVGSKSRKNNSGGDYRDGDIVGGSAPEIASDNRGRAMLEKMGWSSGTALGALDNKGILQPVIHIVKTTKAGLG